MIASFEFYRDNYKGRITTQEEVELYLDRATADIYLYAGQFELVDLDDVSLNYIKIANCVQAEYYILNGFNNQASFDSVSVGSFSISNNSQRLVTLHTHKYIVLAGLYNRSVRIC